MVGLLTGFALLATQAPNARESYSAAAKLLRTDDFAIAERIKNQDLEDLPSPLPAGLAPSMTPLDVVRWEQKTLAEVLSRVEKGNQIPFAAATAPVAGTLGSAFPDLADHKQVARALVDYGWLALSEGQSQLAVRAILAEQGMSARFADGAVINYLVSVTIQGLTTGFVSEFLPSFTPTDLDRLEALATQRLADRLLLRRVYLGELNYVRGFQRDLREKSPSVSLVVGDLPPESSAFNDPTTTKYFATLTPSRWQQVVDRVSATILRRVNQITSTLDGPESDWAFHGSDPDVKSPVVIRTDDDLEAALLSNYAVFSLDPVVFRSRAQWRLLLLHARIRKYFWNHRRYPDALTDVATKAEIYDPLSRKPFIYEKRDYDYRLVSAGRPGVIGEVALRMRRSSGLAGGRAEGPP